MLDAIDQMAIAEDLAISRLNQIRPHRMLNGKKKYKGKQTNYPYIRSKAMVTESNESREDKFKRIAVKRTSKALQQIRLIGNLATSVYSYTPEQVQKIEAALYTAVEETMAGFNKAKITKPTFDL